MPQLFGVPEVKDQLSRVPGLGLPPTLDDGTLQRFVTQDTATVLRKAGYASLPSPGLARDSLESVAMRLVLNSVRQVLHAMKPDVMEQLRRERDSLLRETEAIVDDAAEQSTDPFLDVVDTLEDPDEES